MRQLTRGKSRALSCAVALGTLAALLPAGHAAAQPAHWGLVTTGVSPELEPAYNVNTTDVAVLRASDHKVLITRGGRVVEDIGRPAGPVVRELSITGTDVYALTDDGVVTHFDRTGRVWQYLGGGFAHILASRAGTYVFRDNQPPRFVPDLYAVGPTGGVFRLRGEARLQNGGYLWETIGRDPDVDSLAERGSSAGASLFEHTTGGLVRQWTDPGWVDVGGGMTSISADLSTLIGTDTYGKVQVYDAPSGTWHPFPSSHIVVPYTPRGRAIAAVDTVYYQTDTGDIYGRRSIPGLDVWGAWVHLAAGYVTAIAPHLPSGAGPEASALRPDGTVTDLAWEQLDVRVGTRAITDVGGIYEDFSTTVLDWSGYLGVVVLSGSLPPGIAAGTSLHGEVVLAGTPTAVGTWTSTLLLYDSSGATYALPTTVQVVDATGDTVTTHRFVNPSGPLNLVNCLSDRSQMSVFTRERTSFDPDVETDPMWEFHGTVPSGGGGPTCDATAAGTVAYAAPANHTVEVVAVDNGAPNCAGRNDPDLAGCIVFHRVITGKADTPARNVTVTG